MFLRVLSVDASVNDEYLASQLLADASFREDGIEVGFSPAGRLVRRVVESCRPERRELPDLGVAPVVLVTGGARGITSRLVEALASVYRCRVVLLGRTPLPDEESPVTAGLEDARAIKRSLLAGWRRRGEAVTPAMIESECESILRAREIRRTLDRLRGVTRSLEYESLDVRNAARLADLIDGVRRRHGRIDAVIHGAGIVEDRLLASKSPESFDRVFDTKVVPALTFAEYLDPNETRLVVFVSSVASQFGYAGGTDYCGANDVLNELARTLDRRWPGRVVSIAWGPWEGSGIASRLPVSHFVESQNMIPMPAAEASMEFIREIEAGPDAGSEVLLFAPAGERSREGDRQDSVIDEDHETR